MKFIVLYGPKTLYKIMRELFNMVWVSIRSFVVIFILDSRYTQHVAG